jgi:hypothetical protein
MSSNNATRSDTTTLSTEATRAVLLWIFGAEVINFEEVFSSILRCPACLDMDIQIQGQWVTVLDLLWDYKPDPEQDRATPDWLSIDPVAVPALTTHEECADGFLRAARRLTQRAAELADNAPEVTAELLQLERLYQRAIADAMMPWIGKQQRWQELPELDPA